jgi:pyruvate formate-lyase activating enzyme-like uncharacterized protein
LVRETPLASLVITKDGARRCLSNDPGRERSERPAFFINVFRGVVARSATRRGKRLEGEIVEQYPTYDGTVVERTPLA